MSDGTAPAVEPTSTPPSEPAPAPRAGGATGAFVVLLLGVVAGAFVAWQTRDYQADDVAILLRHGWNWLHHGEPVWNPGERVEGVTSFLHLAAITGLAALGVPWTTAPTVVNTIAFGATVIIFALIARRLSTPTGTLLGLALLVGSRPLVTWIHGGLEAPGVAFFLLAGYGAALRSLTRPTPARGLFAGVLFASATLTRPDALLPSLAGVAAIALAPTPARPAGRSTLGASAVDTLLVGPARRRAALLALVGLLLPLGVHEAWRVSFYGDWVPNTFHTAVEVPESAWRAGLTHLLSTAADPPYWPVLAPISLLIGARDPVRRTPLFILLAVVAAHVGWVVAIGGDALPEARYFVPVVPLACLAFAMGVSAWEAELESTRPLVIAVAVALSLTILGTDRRPPDREVWTGATVGPWIREHWTGDRLVATDAAGTVPFLNPDLRFLDMLGRTDRTIGARAVGAPALPLQALHGHAKGDGAYVLSREPDAIVLGFSEGVDAARPVFLSDLELAGNPEFARCYAKRTEELTVDPAVAALDPSRPTRFPFTWYERTCPKTSP